MTEYRRAHVPGANWFFTVNLAQRKGNTLLVDRIDSLRSAFDAVRERHPFRMDAVVILPEHLHCILTLGAGRRCEFFYSLESDQGQFFQTG
jgi:putative transposase